MTLLPPPSAPHPYPMGSIGQKLMVGITSKRAAVWTTFSVRVRQFIFDECVVVSCVCGVRKELNTLRRLDYTSPSSVGLWWICASASDIVISECADASLIALQCSVQLMMDYPFEGNFKTFAGKFVGSLKAGRRSFRT